MEREVVYFVTDDSRIPFVEWFERQQPRTQVRVDARLARVRAGNLGDCVSVGNGVKELRDHSGPGYRLYVAERGPKMVVLLCAGDKSSQFEDIRRAKSFLEVYAARP